MGQKILVIGSGGREHVIAQKILESPLVEAVFCARGNAGMAKDGIQLLDIDEENHPALIRFAKENDIDWTFVGPEIPLLNGIVDDFQAEDLLIFGPTKAAAMIEGSKDFAKNIMKKYNIPTADYQTFTDYEKAKSYIEKKGTPIVIKADGLAAGKGVIVAETEKQALAALSDMLKENKFGASGAKVVIEEFLEGEEFSLLSFVKNEKAYPMVIAQDHKRAFDGDQGPNTGGMGAYSPVPQISEALLSQAVKEVVEPAVNGMSKEGCSFTGILYAGLIATKSGPKVIEFNARFGDPETQVVLQRLESDFAGIISDLLHSQEPDIRWKKTGFSLGVVVAAEGYPGAYAKDILLPEVTAKELESCQLYFAGVTEKNGKLVSDGGRVYLVEASGETLEKAQQKVYDLLNRLDTSGTFYRKDIGAKAIHFKTNKTF